MSRNLRKWFDFKNQGEDKVQLYFYGDIVMDSWDRWGDDDKYPQMVADALKEANGKPLEIFINSGGGSAFAGHAIYNILSRYNAKKIVRVDGLAASAASVIAMAGDEIHIPGSAYLMIHKPWTSCFAKNASEFRKVADTLDIIEEGMISVYEKKLAEGVDIETIKELVAAETWLTGEDAAKYFDIIVEKAEPVFAYASEFFDTYKNAPRKFIDAEESKRDEIKKQEHSKQEFNMLIEELELISSFIFIKKVEELKNE